MGRKQTAQTWLHGSIVVVLAGFLAACTASGTGPLVEPEARMQLPTSAASVPVTAMAIDPAPEPVGGPAVAGGGSPDRAGSATVKVALLLPLTGAPGTVEVAKALRQAAEMAILEFDNPNVVLSTKDTKSSQEGARVAAQEAVNEGCELIIGPLFAREVQAVSPVAAAARISVVALSSDKAVAGRGTYLLSFIAGQEVDRIVSYAVGRGKRTFAALVPEGIYGRILEGSFRDAVQANGGRLIAVSAFPANANGMLEPVRKLKEAAKASAALGVPLDAVFVPAGADTLPILAPLLPYNEIDTRQVTLLGSSEWDFQNVGREAALIGGWYPAPDPRGWNEFTQRYAKVYGAVPPRIASLAYDAVSLAITVSAGPPGQRFTQANLTRASGFSGIDGLFRLRPDGLSQRGLAVVEVQKFATTVIDPAPASFSEQPQLSAAINTGVSSSSSSASQGPGPRFNLIDAQ